MNLNSVIQIKNASIFQQNKLILSDVNLELEKGELAYLIGKVGSGKTSLMKTLYAELPLLKGEGYVANFELHHLKKKAIPFLRRKLGIIFQDFQLLTDRDVYENLKFVLEATGWKEKQAINQRVTEVLNDVNLLNKLHEMPHRLSGGEQQRIGIARALLNKPAIILADEPTGNIDPETSLEIINLLHAISKNGSTVVIATHNHALVAKVTGRVFICENNKVKELV